MSITRVAHVGLSVVACFAVASPASAAQTCNKDAHSGGEVTREMVEAGEIPGSYASTFARELGGLGQFTGPGNSGASQECRDAR